MKLWYVTAKFTLQERGREQDWTQRYAALGATGDDAIAAVKRELVGVHDYTWSAIEVTGEPFVMLETRRLGVSRRIKKT